MLYLLCGKDTFRSKEKQDELLEFFRSKIGETGFFKINPENFSPANFEELLRSKSLFEKKNIILCKNILANKSIAGFISKNLARCKESDNIFLFVEEEIDEDLLTSFKENAEKVQNFEHLSGLKLKKWIENQEAKDPVASGIKISQAKKEEIMEFCGSDLWCIKKEMEKYFLVPTQIPIQGLPLAKTYNPFTIGDAIARKDRKTAWISLQEAMINGITAEEIFWKIWWQVKTLLLVNQLLQAKVRNLEKESGLHPYVVKKALSALKNFNDRELSDLSWKMVDLHHRSKINLIGLDLGLEKIIVNL